jgi:hypothetical protein
MTDTWTTRAVTRAETERANPPAKGAPFNANL